jgi:FkbM family methyltransferase
MLRRVLTSTLINLGADNRLALGLVGLKCKRFNVRLDASEAYLGLIKKNREIRIAKRHFVYAPSLAENFETYFNDLKPRESSGMLVLDYSQVGRLQTYLGSGLEFELASFPEEQDAIESYFNWYKPREGDVVFDIGAHCGVSTYHFAKLVGERGKVFAFEPDPTNYRLLLRNIDRHNLSNVIPLQLAIARECGNAPFSAEQTIGSGLVRYMSRISVGEIVTVETATLQAVFERFGPPQFCKIDIEGAEIDAISAAAAYLKAEMPKTFFALDTNHLVGGAYTDGRIEALFHSAGYEAKSSSSGMKTTWTRPA